MKLAISNIAWQNDQDQEMYAFLKKHHITGLEIAPTRIFPEKPYDNLVQAKELADSLKGNYDLEICSMQSIWFGRTEKLFGSKKEQETLLNYTKKAILFAEVIGCHNLVFGSPKNRVIATTNQYHSAVSFFKELGDFAYSHNTVLAMEANPVIYNTNFINTTSQAIDLVKEVDSKGFKVNLDLGTVIYNQEDINMIDLAYVNHIHISEPYLKEIMWGNIHNQLLQVLNKNNYQGFISIEMSNQNTFDKVKEMIISLKQIYLQELENGV